MRGKRAEEVGRVVVEDRSRAGQSALLGSMVGQAEGGGMTHPHQPQPDWCYLLVQLGYSGWPADGWTHAELGCDLADALEGQQGSV